MIHYYQPAGIISDTLVNYLDAPSPYMKYDNQSDTLKAHWRLSDFALILSPGSNLSNTRQLSLARYLGVPSDYPGINIQTIPSPLTNTPPSGYYVPAQINIPYSLNFQMTSQ